MVGPQHMEEVLDNVPSALITIDRSNTVIYRNEPAARLAPQLEPGVNVWDALKPVVNEEKIDRMMRGERVVFSTGSGRPMLEWLIADDRLSDGTVILMAWDVVITDELVEGRITFIVSASHELRSPMTALLGFAEILELQSSTLTTTQAEAATVIRQNAEHLQSMVDDIIDLSRNSFGELTLEIGEVDIVPIIDQVSETLRPQIEDRGQTLDVDVEDGVPTIEADSKRVRQIVFNLLQNAQAHTGDGSSIRISAGKSGDGVAIVVEDDGPGVPFDNPDDVFRSFRRGPATGVRSIPGSGIGLTISRQLAELHRGSIKLESSPGEGSKFTVWLPASRDAARRLVTPDR